METKLIALELNEINFDLIAKYIEDGHLPNFKQLFDRHGFAITESESEYQNLEPWIQWVTVHTGKTFKEHKMFRLGQIKESNIEQIWERLEKQGVSSGAMSPMNADNRLSNAKFFVPDPWTRARVSGGKFLESFYNAVAQAVNDNASERISKKSVLTLLLGAARFARPVNYLEYLRLVIKASKKKWNKALFLDLLLADCFYGLTKSKQPQYATLFLNAGAHIQHHYMFSSKHCVGESKNPEWYVPAGVDPVYEVYQTYDRILGQLRAAFPAVRFQLITGLHQTAYAETTYYWRLVNHEKYLHNLGLEFASVEPRMSRDFLINCSDMNQAKQTVEKLGRVQTMDKIPIFKCDRKGTNVFVELVFDQEIVDGFTYRNGNEVRSDFKLNVAFVAIKNGGHNGDGYYLDTKIEKAQLKNKKIRLEDLFGITLAAFL